MSDDLQLFREQDNYEQLTRERLYESGDVMIWKMAQFDFSPATLESIMGKAQKHGTLIIDVRDNGGGAVACLNNLVGHLFDHDVKIADVVSRTPSPSMGAKHAAVPYTGKVIILINSKSASASELLARVVQLEHRGTVIGDRSAGAVMEARQFVDVQGGDTQVRYGYSVTVANLIMADGKSLENVGVVPDETVLPTPQELASGADPVLVKAVGGAGLTLDATAAGKLFPFEWSQN